VSQFVTVEAAGLLFDMDGVLVSSLGSVVRSWRQWAEEYGVPDADQVVVPHGTRAVEIMESLKPGVDIVAGLKRIEDIEVADVHDIELLDGVKALLDSLPKDRWTIVTSATRLLLLARLGAAGLPVPNELITAESVTRGKPDPEPYRKGAEIIGQDVTKCVVVEDAPNGIGAGLAAGARVIAVAGTHTVEELRATGATWVVETLANVRATATNAGITLEIKAV
jgi:sugar-phosphatase